MIVEIMNDVKNYFNMNSEILAKKYDSISTEKVHKNWMNLINFENISVLDIGCGSGRDALFMSSLGADVTAVDFSENMLLKARNKKYSDKIVWIEDDLPLLKKIDHRGKKYDLILISAVLMYLSPREQVSSIERVILNMKPDGMLVFSIKYDKDDKLIYNLCDGVLEALHNKHMNISVLSVGGDVFYRKDINWSVYIASFLPIS